MDKKYVSCINIIPHFIQIVGKIKLLYTLYNIPLKKETSLDV